jgi:hypothetical protein
MRSLIATILLAVAVSCYVSTDAPSPHALDGAAGAYNIAPGSPAHYASTYPIAVAAEPLTLANTWTTVNSNGGAAFNEYNRLCRVIRVYVMQHQNAQWSCYCDDFTSTPYCQNATAWLGVRDATCAGTNCSEGVGWIKQGSGTGLLYRARYNMSNSPSNDNVGFVEYKEELTPQQVKTGELFTGTWSSHTLRRYVP